MRRRTRCQSTEVLRAAWPRSSYGQRKGCGPVANPNRNWEAANGELKSMRFARPCPTSRFCAALTRCCNSTVCFCRPLSPSVGFTPFTGGPLYQAGAGHSCSAYPVVSTAAAGRGRWSITHQLPIVSTGAAYRTGGPLDWPIQLHPSVRQSAPYQLRPGLDQADEYAPLDQSASAWGWQSRERLTVHGR